MKKRILPLLTLAVVSIVALASCGAKTTPTKAYEDYTGNDKIGSFTSGGLNIKVRVTAEKSVITGLQYEGEQNFIPSAWLEGKDEQHKQDELKSIATYLTDDFTNGELEYLVDKKGIPSEKQPYAGLPFANAFTPVTGLTSFEITKDGKAKYKLTNKITRTGTFDVAASSDENIFNLNISFPLSGENEAYTTTAIYNVSSKKISVKLEGTDYELERKNTINNYSGALFVTNLKNSKENLEITLKGKGDFSLTGLGHEASEVGNYEVLSSSTKNDYKMSMKIGSDSYVGHYSVDDNSLTIYEGEKQHKLTKELSFADTLNWIGDATKDEDKSKGLYIDGKGFNLGKNDKSGYTYVNTVYKTLIKDILSSDSTGEISGRLSAIEVAIMLAVLDATTY